MNPCRRKPASFVQCVLLALPLFLQGCIAHSALKGEPGKDISGVREGISLEQVEAVMGKSTREWSASTGVRYRIYRYDAGAPPSKFNAFRDFMGELATLGLVSLYTAATAPEMLDKRPQEEHVMREMAVSYDSQDRVIGVFPDVDNSTVLPVDGRPLKN